MIYTVRFAEALWVIQAFQKKSKTEIKTPQTDVDRI
jgi:phage-related protein